MIVKRVAGIALMLLLALCAAVIAEEQALPAMPEAAVDGPAEIGFDEAQAPFAGVWVPFEDGFALYLPAAWRAFELTEDQRAAGLFYRAGDGEGAGMAVGYAAAGDLDTMDALAADYRGAGFENVGRLLLDGIEAVGFERPEAGYRGAAFFHPDYPLYVLTVYVTPPDAGDATGRAILESIRRRSGEA